MDKKSKRESSEKKRERERKEREKEENEKKKAEAKSATLHKKAVDAAAKNADSLLKKTKKVHDALALTDSNQLSRYVPAHIKQPFDEAIREINKVRSEAQKAKDEEATSFSFDLRSTDKLCAHGFRVESIVRDLLTQFQAMGTVYNS